jgi:hypothetical protein
MINRQENIKSPLDEQLPQRDRGSRNVMRPGALPIVAQCVATAAFNRSRAIAVSSALMRGPSRGPGGTSIAPFTNRADRPVPSVTGRAMPQIGSSAPMPACCAPGASRKCWRTQVSRSLRKASASASGAHVGRLSETRPSDRLTRKENRRARAFRRKSTVTGGSPGRMWVELAAGVAK